MVNSIKGSEKPIHVISYSPGYGKTFTSLLYVLLSGRKTIFCVPRIELAKSLYESVIEEIGNMKSSSLNVALYFSGKFQKNNFTYDKHIAPKDCDIIIITIDSLLARASKNSEAILMIDTFSWNIVFDEYHMLINKDPLFAAFINLLRSRMDFTDKKTILLSGTPIPLGGIIENDKIDYHAEEFFISPKAAETKVRVHLLKLKSIEELSQYNTENTATFLPTVQSAQRLYKSAPKDSHIYHSQYTEEDREKKRNECYKYYDKNSMQSEKPPIISTPIIGTGTQLSFGRIIDYATSPEESIQRVIGRASRFNEYPIIDWCLVIVENENTNEKGIHRFMCKNFSNELREKWLTCIGDSNGEELTKKMIFQKYHIFLTKNEKEIRSNILSLFRESKKTLHEIPYKSGGYYIQEDDVEKIGRSFTYRGKSENFFGKVKRSGGNGHEVIECNPNLLYREKPDYNPKEAHKYLLSCITNSVDGDKHKAERILEYGLNIKHWSDLTIERYAEIASRSDWPLPLKKHLYSSDIGLYFSE